MREFRPKKQEEFWCSICDSKIVNSDDPSTGKFFKVWGHEYNQQTEEVGKYNSVVFSICKHCLKLLKS